MTRRKAGTILRLSARLRQLGRRLLDLSRERVYDRVGRKLAEVRMLIPLLGLLLQWQVYQQRLAQSAPGKAGGQRSHLAKETPQRSGQDVIVRANGKEIHEQLKMVGGGVVLDDLCGLGSAIHVIGTDSGYPHD